MCALFRMERGVRPSFIAMASLLFPLSINARSSSSSLRVQGFGALRIFTSPSVAQTKVSFNLSAFRIPEGRERFSDFAIDCATHFCACQTLSRRISSSVHGRPSVISSPSETTSSDRCASPSQDPAFWPFDSSRSRSQTLQQLPLELPGRCHLNQLPIICVGKPASALLCHLYFVALAFSPSSTSLRIASERTGKSG